MLFLISVYRSSRSWDADTGRWSM